MPETQSNNCQTAQIRWGALALKRGGGAGADRDRGCNLTWTPRSIPRRPRGTAPQGGTDPGGSAGARVALRMVATPRGVLAGLLLLATLCTLGPCAVHGRKEQAWGARAGDETAWPGGCCSPRHST